MIENRIHAFVELGKFLSQFKTSGIVKNDTLQVNNPYFDILSKEIKKSINHNGWFTEENVLFALESWSNSLTTENLTKWLSNYNLSQNKHKTVAIIMAGNIPLVGFHDFLSVLITGNSVLIKQSSNDKVLLPILVDFLTAIEPSIKGKVSFTEQKLTSFDAVIATGSDNTSRYFDYYFGKHPNIIRKNRNSVAVLTGNETIEELENLGEDIFRYFGLGCRSVSKIFVPTNYNFDTLFNAIYKFNDVINYKKYENNYDYNKAVYLMSQFKILENGFFMIKEDSSYASPIATLFYEYYDDINTLNTKLQIDQDKIQCIVSKETNNTIYFGKTQTPDLWDYADNVDTINFLLKN